MVTGGGLVIVEKEALVDKYEERELAGRVILTALREEKRKSNLEHVG